MSPQTITHLEEMGTVTNDDRAKAYQDALEKRLDNLYELQELLQLPWYGQVYVLRRLLRLHFAILREQNFLERSKKLINWNAVKDSSIWRVCIRLEQIERKLLNSLGYQKHYAL